MQFYYLNVYLLVRSTYRQFYYLNVFEYILLVSHANHSATETSLKRMFSKAMIYVVTRNHAVHPKCGDFVCIDVCIYACMHLCMYVCIYVCMYVCMYVYMYVCMSVSMYVCMYVFASTR